MSMKRLLLAVLAGLAVVAQPLSARSGTITVMGSDTMVILAQKWAEVYMSQTPSVKIQVTGGGSGVGFAALQGQKTDLADASRPIKSKEIEGCIKAFGKRPREYKVCMDGLSVYVNNDNPVKQITLEQLAGVFTGKIANWKEIGGNDAPITIYSRENSSGTYEFFKEHVLHGTDFAASAQTMPGTAALLQAVEKDKSGIGYGGAAYGAGARALAVSKDAGSPAITPSEETVVGGTYPISRYLYVYVNPALDKDALSAYVKWIRSDDGQKVVKEIGYYPLPKNYRN
jgi:phosphate transport system substrate-binding protein